MEEYGERFDFKATVVGELASKSNQRQIVRRGRRTISIKSSKALLYVQGFLLQLRRPAEPYDGLVAFYIIVYYASQRPDLDIALVQDCLQAAGIIKNDRQVREIHAWHKIDRVRPRVEFTVRSIPGPSGPPPKEEGINVEQSDQAQG